MGASSLSMALQARAKQHFAENFVLFCRAPSATTHPTSLQMQDFDQSRTQTVMMSAKGNGSSWDFIDQSPHLPLQATICWSNTLLSNNPGPTSSINCWHIMMFSGLVFMRRWMYFVKGNNCAETERPAKPSIISKRMHFADMISKSTPPSPWRTSPPKSPPRGNPVTTSAPFDTQRPSNQSTYTSD